MSEKVPIPLDKLPLIAKRGLFQEYFDVVGTLTNRLSDAISLRLKVDPSAGLPVLLGSGDVSGASIDEETAPLIRAKFDATSLLDMFSSLIKEQGEDFWEANKLELGDFVERLVHRKHECEMVLLDLEMEFEYHGHNGGANA